MLVYFMRLEWIIVSSSAWPENNSPRDHFPEWFFWEHLCNTEWVELISVGDFFTSIVKRGTKNIQSKWRGSFEAYQSGIKTKLFSSNKISGSILAKIQNLKTPIYGVKSKNKSNWSWSGWSNTIFSFVLLDNFLIFISAFRARLLSPITHEKTRSSDLHALVNLAARLALDWCSEILRPRLVVMPV